MYTAHTCSRALEGLYSGGVVMTFYLEYAAPAIAYIYQAGIFFPGLYQQLGAIARQGLQPFYGVFVAAMLTPHYGVHGYFIKIGGTAQYFFYLFKFFFAKAEFGGLFEGSLHSANVQNLVIA